MDEEAAHRKLENVRELADGGSLTKIKKLLRYWEIEQEVKTAKNAVAEAEAAEQMLQKKARLIVIVCGGRPCALQNPHNDNPAVTCPSTAHDHPRAYAHFAGCCAEHAAGSLGRGAWSAHGQPSSPMPVTAAQRWLLVGGAYARRLSLRLGLSLRYVCRSRRRQLNMPICSLVMRLDTTASRS